MWRTRKAGGVSGAGIYTFGRGRLTLIGFTTAALLIAETLDVSPLPSNARGAPSGPMPFR